MTVTVAVPGVADLHLDHLLLDVNGTLTSRGELLAGIADTIALVRLHLTIRLLSADTHGTLADVAHALGGLPAERVSDGAGKAAILADLGAARCAAIGNGANDEAMLRAAGLGIAVIGPEGASPKAIHAADVVCLCVLDALNLLLDPRTLAATLRP